MSWEEALNLASFLGEKLHNLHLLPCPALTDSTLLVNKQKTELLGGNVYMEDSPDKIGVIEELQLFIKTLNKKKEDLCSRLTKWYSIILFYMLPFSVN